MGSDGGPGGGGLRGRVTSTALMAGARCWSPVIARYRGGVKRPFFRGDAAFANPEMYEYLDAEGIGYAIRLPAKPGLAGQDRILAQAPRWATTARGAPLLCQLRLSGAELE